MSSRELIILILGLAIVAVVLRGLFVALRARKGQIRLSIDKNIPSDIDLEALEMSELPSGGARVVARSLDSVNKRNSRLDAALERAEGIQLGASGEKDNDVPILMDAVSLSSPTPPSRQAAEADSGSAANPVEGEYSEEALFEPEENDESIGYIGEESIDPEIDFAEEELIQPPQLGELHEDTEEDLNDDEIWENQDVKEESADDVLLDYEDYSDDDEEVSNSLASLAPDYESDSDRDAEEVLDEELPVEDQHTASDDFDDDEDLGEIEDEQETASDIAPAKSFEDQLDDFSLSAGERIGFNKPSEPAPSKTPAKLKAAEVSQPSLFDDELEIEEEPEIEKSKPMSFFSAFKRSITPQEKTLETPSEKPRAAAPAESVPVETAAADDSAPTQMRVAEPSAPAANKEREKAAAPRSRAQAEYEAESASGPAEVLVLNVMAKDGFAFAGDDLLQVLIMSGLKFGEMNIFHQRIGADKKGPVLFSVANVLNPGTFDLNNMDNFTTLGVSFFLALPSVMNNLEAFEKMLAVAQQIKAGLDGELKDDNRNMMTSQTIEHYRQRVRDFELRRLKAAGARH